MSQVLIAIVDDDETVREAIRTPMRDPDYHASTV